MASLRIDAATSGAVSGTCEPGEDLFGHAFATGSASFGGVCAGDGSVSRSGSFSAAGFGAWFAYQDDDLGSGTTLVNLPALVSAAPQPNASMPASGWDAYAALSGPPNPYHPGSPAATPAEVLAATSLLSLAIAPAAGTSAVFSSDAALGSDTQGVFGGVRVGALPVGRYTANWTLTDGHGDTQQLESLFFAQPDPGGSGGSTGVSARKHVSYLMRCVRKTPRHDGHGLKERSCTVIVRAPWARLVTVVISRHRTTFARGRARVKAGRARVSMRNLRRLGSGTYEVTITASAGVTRRVVRRTLHL